MLIHYLKEISANVSSEMGCNNLLVLPKHVLFSHKWANYKPNSSTFNVRHAKYLVKEEIFLKALQALLSEGFAKLDDDTFQNYCLYTMYLTPLICNIFCKIANLLFTISFLYLFTFSCRQLSLSKWIFCQMYCSGYSFYCPKIYK